MRCDILQGHVNKDQPVAIKLVLHGQSVYNIHDFVNMYSFLYCFVKYMLTHINVCVTQICLELLLRLNSGTLSYILSTERWKVNVFMMGFLMLEPLFQITVKSAGK